MPAIAPIVIYDGATPPVGHSFNPESIIGDVATWTDRATGIAVGYSYMTQQVRKPVKGSTSKVYKVTQKVWVPTLEVTSPSTSTGIQPAPTQAYQCMCVLEWLLPERSNVANRKDLYAFVYNYLATSQPKAAIENFEPVT
jgi:hypothetical protein